MATLACIDAKIQGVVFYAGIAKLLRQNLVQVLLRRERDNPHDDSSVLVTTRNGEVIGHIDKETAASVSVLIDSLHTLKFICVCTTGEIKSESGSRNYKDMYTDLLIIVSGNTCLLSDVKEILIDGNIQHKICTDSTTDFEIYT